MDDARYMWEVDGSSGRWVGASEVDAFVGAEVGGTGRRGALL